MLDTSENAVLGLFCLKTFASFALLREKFLGNARLDFSSLIKFLCWASCEMLGEGGKRTGGRLVRIIAPKKLL